QFEAVAKSSEALCAAQSFNEIRGHFHVFACFAECLGGGVRHWLPVGWRFVGSAFDASFGGSCRVPPVLHLVVERSRAGVGSEVAADRLFAGNRREQFLEIQHVWRRHCGSRSVPRGFWSTDCTTTHSDTSKKQEDGMFTPQRAQIFHGSRKRQMRESAQVRG